MSHLTLRRLDEIPGDCTLGRLYEGEEFLCRTLELQWHQNILCISCIPPGTYTVRPKRNSERYRFDDTETRPRTAIEIHVGNTADDTHGCIVVGAWFSATLAPGQVAVTHSRKTLEVLRKRYPKGFELTILGV